MQRTSTFNSKNIWDYDPVPPYSSTPEHICSTTAEAFQIIKEKHLCPFDAFEEKYGALIDSKAAVAEPRYTEISQEIDKILSTEYFHFEFARAMRFAGHRFRLRNSEAGYGFENAMEIELHKKQKALRSRRHKLERHKLLYGHNPFNKLKSGMEKSPLPEGDHA